MKPSSLIASIFGIIIAVVIGAFLTKNVILTTSSENTKTNTNETAEENAGLTANVTFPAPNIENVPDSKEKEAILFGYNLVNETNVYAEENVGANLSCSSCHANGGLDESVASLVGVSANYPKFMPRAGNIVTIEERINGCMVRSMNGKKFESNSKELKAMVAYFKYISEGVPIGAEREWAKSVDMKVVPTPSVDDGEKLYQKTCIACHAEDGSGSGPNSGPALWGKDSFNDGAGLARMSKMAGYIKEYMPVGNEGTLSDQDAANLAAYILTQDRPEWSGHAKDWPDGAPSDIMTKERRDQAKNGTLNWDEVLADFQ